MTSQVYFSKLPLLGHRIYDDFYFLLDIFLFDLHFSEQLFLMIRKKMASVFVKQYRSLTFSTVSVKYTL